MEADWASGMDARTAGLAVQQLLLAGPGATSPAAAPLSTRPSLLPEAGACMFALLIQVTVWCSTASNLALRGHLHQALICCGFLLSLRIATHPSYTRSRFWQRNRYGCRTPATAACAASAYRP